MLLKHGIGIILFLASCLVFGQDSLKTRWVKDSVKVGTRFDIHVNRSGKVIYKITREQLERQYGRRLADILNEIPGMQIDGVFNSPNSSCNYSSRGGHVNQTLILIDGIPINNPLFNQAFYDLRNISIETIEAIEVLLGGLSTLYGSGASTGIIAIQTKRSTVKGINGEVNLNAGTWSSYAQSVILNGNYERFSFMVSAANSLNSFVPSPRNDNTSFGKRGFSLRASYQFNANFNLDVFGDYSMIDQFSGSSVGSQQLRLGAKGIYKLSKGTLETILHHSKNTIAPDFYDFTGTNTFSEIAYNLQINSFARVLSGVSFQHLNYSSIFKKNDYTIIDPFTSLFIAGPLGIDIQAGVRISTHSRYNSLVLYNINPSRNIAINSRINLKLFGSISTSFVSPTNFQFSTAYPDLPLKPEQNTSYEYGLSLNVERKLTITAVKFNRNEINSIPVFESRNTKRQIAVDGFSLDITKELSMAVSANADFTYLTSNTDIADGIYPAIKFGTSLTVSRIKNTKISIGYHYTDARTEQSGNVFYESNGRYYQSLIDYAKFDVVDFSTTYELPETGLLLYFSANNLLDRYMSPLTPSGQGSTIVSGSSQFSSSIGRNIVFGVKCDLKKARTFLATTRRTFFGF